jgi:hypothetical protein
MTVVAVLAAVSKHAAGGIAGMAVGALLAVVGLVRAVLRLTAVALLVVGVLLVAGGALLYTHVVHA